VSELTDRLIVITAPDIFEKEAEVWLQLLQSGVPKLHIRKPGSNSEQIIKLIEEVPEGWRKNLIIHHHPEIMKGFQLGGVHLSVQQFNHQMNNGYSVSYSVHNWQEMESIANYCDYAFISPVFDSISKNGYKQNEALQKVPEQLQSKKIYALGGVQEGNIKTVRSRGYYGAALLGCIWKELAKAVQQWEKIMVNFTKQ
jgi:thiamine-phosphate pyrophosphorylase